MNFGPILFLGIFLTFASAWIGLVFMPTATLKNVQATMAEGSTVANPRPYTGQEQLGRADRVNAILVAGAPHSGSGD